MFASASVIDDKIILIMLKDSIVRLKFCMNESANSRCKKYSTNKEIICEKIQANAFVLLWNQHVFLR